MIGSYAWSSSADVKYLVNDKQLYEVGTYTHYHDT